MFLTCCVSYPCDLPDLVSGVFGLNMPFFKKKVERRKSLSRKEISLVRLENFRREVITDDHTVSLGEFSLVEEIRNVGGQITHHSVTSALERQGYF